MYDHREQPFRFLAPALEGPDLMTPPSLFEMPADVDGSTGDSPAPREARTADPGVAQTLALYRKYRPQTFDAEELVGQEHVVQTLKNAIRLGRIGHAYLFCGPRGTGKTTTARLLAKAVNCLDPNVDARPCGVCTACVAISNGSATDVIEIDAASNRGIDDIRELRERVKYAPTQLRTKFYIIDEAHQITGAAANAFLKTLEEPPVHTKFVLATTDPEELLPTIVSRCQRFDFRRITLEAMIARLETVAAAEGLTVEPDAYPVIARHATGSLRDALGLLDQLAVYRDQHGSDDVVTADLVRALLGVSRNDRVEALVIALADRDANAALGTVNSAVEAGEDPRQLNRQLVSYLRVLLHERAGGSPDADARAKELAQRFELYELVDLARRFSETDYRIKRSPYGQLPLEVALVDGILRDTKVANVATQTRQTPAPAAEPRPAPIEPPARDVDLLAKPPTTALRDRIRGSSGGSRPTASTPPGRSADASRPAEAPAAEPPPPASPPRRSIAETNGSAGPAIDLDVEKLVDLWPQICADVKAVNRRIEALLREADPVAVRLDQITIATAYDFHRSKLNADDVRPVIEDAVSRLVGRRLQVSCVLRGEVPPMASAVPSAPMNTQPPAPPFSTTTANGDAEPLDDTATAPGTPTDAPAASSAEDDERRLQAAKNIFDADVIG